MGKSVGALNGASYAQFTLGTARFVGGDGRFSPSAYARDVRIILAFAVGLALAAIRPLPGVPVGSVGTLTRTSPLAPPVGVAVFFLEAPRGQTRETGDGEAEG